MKKFLLNRFVFITIQIVITIFFLYITFSDENYHTLTAHLSKINYFPLIIAILIQVFGVIFISLREKFLLKIIYLFKFNELIEGVLISYVGNNVLPLRSGEFLKTLYWKKISNKSYVSLLSIAVIERLLDILLLIIVFFTVSDVLADKLNIHVEWLFIIFVVLMCPALLLLFLDWKYEGRMHLHHVIHRLLGEYISFWITGFLEKVLIGLRVLGSFFNLNISFVFTILYWIINWCGIMLFLHAFHLSVHFEMSLVIMLAIAIGVMIPSAPGYLGTFDYFAKKALMIYGVNSSVAASFAIVSHAVSIVPITLLAISFIYPILVKLMKESNELKQT